MSRIKLLYIDLFCGAGGTSSGVEQATLHGEKCAHVVACVDHDKNAILSHAANHPDAMHCQEDIRTLELSPMVSHLQKMKLKYPDAHVVLWASLECTNFSRAKGGRPRDADSRTLAEHLFRYIEAINPDYIQIENVEEFMCWGDLDASGKPVSKDHGRKYMKWVRNVKSYGYDYDYRILNAADFGAYTSRKRLFGQFARSGLPIAFPIQTYAKNGDEGGMFHQYKKWKAVREVLDLDDEGTSIFEKKKLLCERTLERIHAGLVKFVAGGKRRHEPRISKYYPPSTEEPCPCQNRPGAVSFLSKQFSGRPEDKNISIDGPAGAITTIDHHAFITACYGATKDRLSTVRPHDSPMTRKVKEFMAIYGITDIKMRMLKTAELKKIMGFEDYTLIGTQAEQRKFIGNAVEVNMSRRLCEALCNKLEGESHAGRMNERLPARTLPDWQREVQNI